MEYEAELDIQIAALEKEIERRKRIRAFWEKSIPGEEKLLKKWKPMVEHLRKEKNRLIVAFNLEVMNILLDKHNVDNGWKENGIKTFIMPIMARCKENGDVWE